MRKREKILWIVLAFVLVFSFILVPSYKAIKAKINAPKIEQQEKEWEISQSYEKQNQAFGLSEYSEKYDVRQYIPYSEFNEKYLIILVNAYNYEKSSNLELKDIEEFLKEPTNADGSPKTYLDASEIVEDFVDWCYKNNGNNGAIETYESNLQAILTEYVRRYNQCSFSGLKDIPIEEINVMCSYYTETVTVNTYPYNELREEWVTYDKKT